jgi:hypothetical protein
MLIDNFSWLCSAVVMKCDPISTAVAALVLFDEC